MIDCSVVVMARNWRGRTIDATHSQNTCRAQMRADKAGFKRQNSFKQHFGGV